MPRVFTDCETTRRTDRRDIARFCILRKWGQLTTWMKHVLFVDAVFEFECNLHFCLVLAVGLVQFDSLVDH